jgi:hypothetical protein
MSEETAKRLKHLGLILNISKTPTRLHRKISQRSIYLENRAEPAFSKLVLRTEILRSMLENMVREYCRLSLDVLDI